MTVNLRARASPNEPVHIANVAYISRAVVLLAMLLLQCGSTDKGGDSSRDAAVGGTDSGSATVSDCTATCEKFRSNCGGPDLGFCPEYCAKFPVAYRECVQNAPAIPSNTEACVKSECCSCPYNSYCGNSYEDCVAKAGY